MNELLCRYNAKERSVTFAISDEETPPFLIIPTSTRKYLPDEAIQLLEGFVRSLKKELGIEDAYKELNCEKCKGKGCNECVKKGGKYNKYEVK